MNILGLHFGHDAAVCVLHNGEIASYVLRERYNRVKHALGLSDFDIDAALEAASLTIQDIDRIAITSTQDVELMTNRIEGFEIQFAPHPEDNLTSVVLNAMQRSNVTVEDIQRYGVRNAFSENKPEFYAGVLRAVFPEGAALDWQSARSVGWIDNYIEVERWTKPRGLEELAAERAYLEEQLRFGFHLPVTVEWRGRKVPGCFVAHHMAHAASVFYRSTFDRAAIMTHDGFATGNGYHGGLFAFGDGTRLWPVSPHNLVLGAMYDNTAGLVGVGDAGKLMGLAPYGEPRFFERAFIGNTHDIEARFQTDPVSAWLAHCRERAQQAGYDMAPLGDRAHATEPVNRNIAASTQLLFEETYLAAIRTLARMLTNDNIQTGNLCLSGGTALNCPSNSRIWREGPFDNVFIEPTCDDGGLAIGAALHIYHNLLVQPRQIETTSPSPYLGIPYGESAVEAALETASGIVWSQPDDPAAAAAADLVGDKIIAWFEGGSEAGPRALGHRSILADVRNADNWRRVNHVKGRELWRPFAPIVLAEKAADWFDGCPMPSPYMLFTATVRSTDLPAITHVDGSSRIQTVDASCGGIRHVLEAFDRETGVPVLMNTSFNGPGEPIVETPAHAVAFLQDSDIDVVYIEGRRAVRS